MPPGIQFACPYCGRVTKVPVTLAGKQGRCAGCRKVLEVPTGVPPSGRTPDPEEGLLDVLEARRASERVRRPSERVPELEPRRPSQRVQEAQPGRPSQRTAARRSDQGPVRGRSGAGPVEADDVPADDEGSTTRVPPPQTPPGATEPREPFAVWARRVPLKVWIGLPLAVLTPALGIGLCVLGLRQARENKAGVRMAWWGIGIGSTIMALNLIYLVRTVLLRGG